MVDKVDKIRTPEVSFWPTDDEMLPDPELETKAVNVLDVAKSDPAELVVEYTRTTGDFIGMAFVFLP